MAKASRSKGDIRVMMSKEEFNTMTIAIALLSVQDMEQEAEEQGLSFEDVSYGHGELFNEFTRLSKLYPHPEVLNQ